MPILTSLVCGAAFVTGGVIAIVIFGFTMRKNNKQTSDDLKIYWQTSIRQHGLQLETLSRIADALETDPSHFDTNQHHQSK